MKKKNLQNYTKKFLEKQNEDSLLGAENQSNLLNKNCSLFAKKKEDILNVC